VAESLNFMAKAMEETVIVLVHKEQTMGTGR